MLFEILVLSWLGLVSFSLFSLCIHIVSVDKRLKEISEDLKMFINFYLQKK